MIVEALRKFYNEPVDVFGQWDGSNDDELRDYINELIGGYIYTKFELVNNGDGTATFVFTDTYSNTRTETLVQAGEWFEIASSRITKRAPDEINAKWYPVPDYPPVTGPPNSDA